MKPKTKKVLSIILTIAFFIVVIACSVLYALYPTQTKDIVKKIYTFINEPLPVVGVSLVIIFTFLYKFLATTSIGKKSIKELKEIASNSEKQIEMIINTTEQELERKQAEINDLKAFIEKLCETIPNKKVKEISKEYFSHEETSEEETND